MTCGREALLTPAAHSSASTEISAGFQRCRGTIMFFHPLDRLCLAIQHIG